MLGKYEFLENHGGVKHDFFSDLRDQGLSSLGVTQAERDAAQPYINDAAKDLLPPGGAIPVKPPSNYSFPQITLPKGFSGTAVIMAMLGVAAFFYFKKR